MPQDPIHRQFEEALVLQDMKPNLPYLFSVLFYSTPKIYFLQALTFNHFPLIYICIYLSGWLVVWVF